MAHSLGDLVCHVRRRHAAVTPPTAAAETGPDSAHRVVGVPPLLPSGHLSDRRCDPNAELYRENRNPT